MTNLAHEGMDDMSDYAEANPWIKRRESHRALPLDPAWPTRRSYAPQGRPEQGWQVRPHSCEPFPVVVDRLPEAHDQEDQTDSADRDVVLWMLKGFAVVFASLFCAWVVAGWPYA